MDGPGKDGIGVLFPFQFVKQPAKRFVIKCQVGKNAMKFLRWLVFECL